MGPGLSKPLYTIFSNVKVLKMFSCHVGFSIQLKHTVFWQSASSKKNFVPMNNDAISKVPWSLVCYIFSEISLVGWSLLKLQCETIDSFFISYRYRIIIGRSPGKCKCPKKKVKVFYENETWRSSRTLRTKSSWPNSKEDFLSYLYPYWEYRLIIMRSS